MQRTMLLVRDARLPYPVVVDLFRLASAAEHTYDYPIHFRGQHVASSVKYGAQVTRQEPLGTRFGYEHLWREASGRTDGPVQVSWVDGNRYYTVTSSAAPGTELIFARTGANDPNFNLVSEPMFLLRRRAADHLFASVIEPHGYFSEAEERSQQARPTIQRISVLESSAAGSVIEVAGEGGLRWTVMVANGPASATARHRVGTYEWAGNVEVRGVK
jgi:hypothetical protein